MLRLGIFKILVRNTDFLCLALKKYPLWYTINYRFSNGNTDLFIQKFIRFIFLQGLLM